MCRPLHFDVRYDINPWMTDQIGTVDKISAITSWYGLFDALGRVADVIVMDGNKDCPDMVFTANAGFVLGNKFALSKFATPERQPEEQYFQTHFSERGYTVFQPTHAYEGEGDHLVDSFDRHWVGSGFRTTKLVRKSLEGFLEVELTFLKLIDPRWYHLDTCFCPLPHNELMWYPAAFSDKSQKLIRESFVKTYDVSEEDALKFACNCVVVGKDLFMPRYTEVQQSLEQAGYRVHHFDLGEYLKAGGSAKCLTLLHNHNFLTDAL